MFVHDFVPIGRPVADVVADFGEQIDPWLGSLVSAAWSVDRGLWVALGIDERDLTPPTVVEVRLGQPRARFDGVVVPISWPRCEARYFPALDADLEIASAGQGRTHLQLMGRYEVPMAVEPGSRQSSLAHRTVVTGVRHFLEMLATRLETELQAATEGDL